MGYGSIGPDRDRAPGDDILLTALSGEMPRLQEITRDAGFRDEFPASALAWLRDTGFLKAPLSPGEGGLGWGTHPDSLSALCEALRLLGHCGLAVGRIYEAHVNALVLIIRYGDAAVRGSAALAAREGHLFGLWVTQARDPVRVSRQGSMARLTGGKAFCTAAGHATRAVITAQDDRDRECLAFIDATSLVIAGAMPSLHGMRSTATRPLTMDMAIPASHCFGEPDDYTKEPEFSAGAWRTSAVTAGGLQALIDETIRQLRQRGRHEDPHQSARVGHMLIHAHTATMWAVAAADRCATPDIESRDLTAYVNMARIAVENACLDVIPLVQRTLGLMAFLTANPVEALMRDLATYLRQPAGDEALSEAAIHFSRHANPSSPGLTS